MPVPEAPVPRSLEPDRSDVPGAAERIDPRAPAPDPEPGGDSAATDRLRAVLQTGDPWRDRMGDLVATVQLAVTSTRSVVVVVAVAAGLGVVAFVVLGGDRGGAVDAAQILPKVQERDPLVAPPSDAASEPATPGAAPAGAPPGTAGTWLFVHAAGAVTLPGIHRVPGDARVADLIHAAGGLATDADPDRINLAAPLRDGERIYVPRRGELAAPEVVAGQPDPGGGQASGPPASAVGPASRLDLNRADAAALEALPGIGPATAAAIIGHRTEHGPFTSVDELQEVTGIGPAKLAQLRDLVRV